MGIDDIIKIIKTGAKIIAPILILAFIISFIKGCLHC